MAPEPFCGVMRAGLRASLGAEWQAEEVVRFIPIVLPNRDAGVDSFVNKLCIMGNADIGSYGDGKITG